MLGIITTISDVADICALRDPSNPKCSLTPFFGYFGIAAALVFANIGSSIGTAKSGIGIVEAGVLVPELIMKSIIPVVMAGILGIYGLIISVIINNKIDKSYYSTN